MTIIEIVNEMLHQLGLEPVKQLCKSKGALEQQILALINAQGRMLSRCARWQSLKKTHIFKTVRGKIQPKGLPKDYLELSKDDRFPKLYQIQYDTFRAKDDLIEDIDIAFDYVSKNWVVSEGGSANKSSITEDTDCIKFDEHLFILGLKSQFLEEKGLDFIGSKMEFGRLLEHLVAKNNTNQLSTRRLSY